MSDDLTIGEYLDELLQDIRAKLARLGSVADPDTLQRVSLAIGLRVADPYNLQSLITPPPAHLYQETQDILAVVDELFAEEIAELRDVIADAQEDPAWHTSVEEGKHRGEIPAGKDPLQAIAEMILTLFLGLDDEAAR